MLQLINLSIGYTASLVRSIDAVLHRGDFVCLVGRNGCGKSTLLKTIAALTPPLSGQLQFPAGMSPAHHVGIVLTQVPDLSHTTVFELVAYGRLPHQCILATLRPTDLTAINQAISTVGIDHLRDRITSQLSDGEKQKVMIARALAQGSDVLLLDEPSAFLDYPSKNELMQLLRSIARSTGKIVLLSTHDIDMAKRYAHAIWHIKGQRLHVVAPEEFNADDI